jgi:hypothetical protein
MWGEKSGLAHSPVSVKSTSIRISYQRRQINGFVWDIAVKMKNDAEYDPYLGADKSVRHPLVTTLVAVLFLECAAITAAVIFLILELLIATPDSAVSAIALAVVTALAAVWVAVIGVHTLRGNAWIRGAAITVQVLFIAIAIGSFQGFLPRPDIGWLLLLPAVTVIVLLFTKPVRHATLNRD